MKDKIIVGIDFSEASDKALQYAIGIANTMSSELILTWVDTEDYDKDSIALQTQNRHEAKSQLKERLAELKENYPSLAATYKLRRGMVHRELAFAATEAQARLMVIGTDGINGVEEFRIENNTFRIISQSSCPVISIRKSYQYSSAPKSIMLPIDEMQHTTDKLPMSIQLAKDLNANIRLLNIYHPTMESLIKQTNMHSTKATKILDKEEMLSDISVRIHTDDPKQVVQAAVDNDADLLVIITKPVMSRAQIPEGILAQKIIHFSPIPILSVQAKPI